MQPFLASAAVLFLAVAVPQQQPPPSFSTDVELVTVDAVVLDPQGRPIPGLRAEDFRILEDGEPQAVARFEAIEVAAPAAVPAAEPPVRPRASSSAPVLNSGRVFVLVFDEVHLSPLQAERAKPILEAFLQTGLREGDRVTIVSTGGGAWWNGVMNGARRDLAAFLKHLKGLRPADTSSCAINEYDAQRFYRQRDPGVEARLIRWLNECNPTLDPPVSADLPSDDSRARTPSLREARERRAQLEIAPGRGQIQAQAASVYERANQRRKQTLDGLARLLEGLLPLRGRKSVLLVSEGFILEPGLPEARRVAAASLRANAAVYFLDTRGGAASLSPLHSAEAGTALEGRDQTGFLDAQGHLAEGAESVAVETGGRTLRGDFASALRSVADESTAYYLLGYHPSNKSRDGKFRKIRIETTRPGVEVHARPGYYPPSDAGNDGNRDQLDARVRGALDLAAAEPNVPLRLAAFVLGPASGAKTRTLLLAEAEPRALRLAERGGRLQGSLDTFALVVSRETGAALPMLQRIEVDASPVASARPDADWLSVPREFELLPGTYQARFVVRGPTGQMGAVEHAFVVPPSGLRISTPVLADRPLTADGRAALTARTRLQPRGTLFCQFQVYGATRDPGSGAVQVSARYALTRSDGTPVASLGDYAPMALGADGAPAQTLAIPLDGAASGSHRLTLEIRDQVSGQTRDRKESVELDLDAPGSQP